MNKQRPTWDEYFMRLANVVSTRSTCDRAMVGAVIVKDRQIVSTGYNGSVRGAEHCDDAGHLLVDGHCVRTVHAEINAIVQAAKNGVSTNGCTLYVTHFPCLACTKAILNAGINRIVYNSDYRNDVNASELIRLSGITLKKEVIKNDVF